jgi:endonuclease/exonuclease/phosphatase (EEP) superfamily protein YafD
MRRFGRNLVLLGTGIVALATAIGFAGPWSTTADAFSHGRLHLAVAGVALALVAYGLGSRGALVALASVAANLAAVASYPSAQLITAGTGTPLKVMTVNVLYRASNPELLIARVAEERPDVLVLQEITRANRGLLERLRRDYPWQVDCAPYFSCDVAVLSRRPWQEAGSGSVGDGHARLAWARFGAELGNVTVASLHVRWPLVSNQRKQLDSAWRRLARMGGPVILAGDMNAQPWSAALRGFAAESGLESAGGYQPTWPARTMTAGKPCLLCVPQLQLDHVLVSRSVGVVSVRAGDDAGSDHLPLVAELELPRALTLND